MNAIVKALTPDQKKAFNPIAIELKQGECSFHHPLMVHGSYENRTDKSRRAIVLNVFRDGVISASDKAPLEGVPRIPAGEKMSGQFFPLLFDPRKMF
jgi:ectoine hydroxylase-related dioxygenase (phytanoyl-CoA dioxygenase family)